MRDKPQKSKHDTQRSMRQGEVTPGITCDKLHDPGKQTPHAPPTDHRG